MSAVRDHADKYQVLPDLPPEQFEALKQDIAARGVVVPVIVDEYGQILEGHNRARACHELGINDYPVQVKAGLSEIEKRVFARKLNMLRRHLTREQVRELVRDQLKETPEWSDRRVAQELGVDHKTVGAARSGLAATGEIPQLEKLTGADGKQRPSRRRGNPARQDNWDDEDDEDEDDQDAADVIPAPETKAKAAARRGVERERKRCEKEWAEWGATPERRAKMEHALDLLGMGVDPNSEKVTKLIREASVQVIESVGYDPLAGRSEAEKLEWHLFMLFLSFDEVAGRGGGEPQEVASHVEWILQRPFQNLSEWLGEEGEKFRKAHRMCAISEQFKIDCVAFLTEQQHVWTLPKIINKLETLQKEFEKARDRRGR
jgi:ParB-like chromosome segregation protein Spo0J